MAKPIYVLSGPNLNLLGVREPEIYGRATLDDVRGLCEARAGAHGRQIVFRQSNREGELIDWVQEAGREGAEVVGAGVAVEGAVVAGHDGVAFIAERLDFIGRHEAKLREPKR